MENFFSIRPQDLGWYKGPDYQVPTKSSKFEGLRARQVTGFSASLQTGMGISWRSKKQGDRRLLAPLNTSTKPAPQELWLRKHQPIQGMDFSNALDGDPNNDYVAGIENEVESIVEISLEPATMPARLRISWESAANFAKSVKVYGIANRPEDQVLIGEGSRHGQTDYTNSTQRENGYQKY